MTTASKLLISAKQDLESGDEESSFIKFMKYIGLITHLQKMSAFKLKKEYYSKLIGRKNTEDALATAEKLSYSLKRRYEMKSIEEASYLRDKQKIDGYAAETTDNDRMEVNSNEYSITVPHLYEWINNKNNSLLIIDCRPLNDYLNSHLIYQYCCNVPENIIHQG